MIPTFLVFGGSASEREQAIAQQLTSNVESIKTAVILEGLADGKNQLEANDNLIVTRIAAGCLCCTNNMIMRVYLNRLIQQKPRQLFLSLSSSDHLDQVVTLLSSGGYEKNLELADQLNLHSN